MDGCGRDTGRGGNRPGREQQMNSLSELIGTAIGAGLMTLFATAAVLEIVLKSVALWKSARRSHKGWFICMVIFNTVGILPLIYLLTSGRSPERLA